MKNMNFLRAGELHRRAGRQAAQQDRPVGCTLRWPTEKGGPEGCPFLQHSPPFSAIRQTTFLCSPPARPCVFNAACRKFTFFIWEHGPPARPARRLSNQCYPKLVKKVNPDFLNIFCELNWDVNLNGCEPNREITLTTAIGHFDAVLSIVHIWTRVLNIMVLVDTSQAVDPQSYSINSIAMINALT